MEANPIRLLIHGASGRMGRALLRLSAEDRRFIVVAAVSRSGTGSESAPWFASADLRQCPPFDVAIDFSLPEAFDALLDSCRDRGAALISGTTGLSDHQRDGLEAASRQVPVLWASNFSLGVAVLENLLRQAASALPSWRVRITETHHVHKKDAPSGTALTLSRSLQAGGMQAPEIESIREAEVVGDHVVVLSGPGEVLELSHRAADRDIFALGALEAAARLAGRAPGSYRLGDLLFSPTD